MKNAEKALLDYIESENESESFNQVAKIVVSPPIKKKQFYFFKIMLLFCFIFITQC